MLGNPPDFSLQQPESKQFDFVQPHTKKDWELVK
jgi:hypothetical protein